MGVGYWLHARDLHFLWYLWRPRQSCSHILSRALPQVPLATGEHPSLASERDVLPYVVKRAHQCFTSQVPGYFAAQILGAFTAACIIYGVYYDVLSAVPGSFAGVLITGPASLVPTLSATFFSVFIGAALLSEWQNEACSCVTSLIERLLSSPVLAICAFTDTGNNPATPVSGCRALQINRPC